MGARTGFRPGTFSWVDLATPDTDAAAAFYGALFGWTLGADDGRGAAVFRLDGDAVAGLTRVAGPPTWTSVVTVDDAGAIAGRAVELGGRVLEAPARIGDAGRRAVLADAQGATIAVWQPGTVIGAERVNDAGCLCMNELATPDPDAAAAFYGALFGWTTEIVDTGPDGPPQRLVHNEAMLNAAMGATEPGEAPHWRPYFTVPAAADAVARVAELGGDTVLAPMTIPDGVIAVVRDPQGVEFALFEGEVDP